MFKSLFGGGNDKKKTPSPQEAIQKLTEVEEMLQKKSDFLETKISNELATAKKHGTKNKRVALGALKKKKKLENQLKQIDGTLSTIELQREALENASTNSEVLNVMGVAAKALKGAHQNMDVDDVHELMEDVAEQQELADEISSVISSPTGFGEDLDEDELNAELEMLEQEDLNEQILKIGPNENDLPTVPTTEPVAANTAQEKQNDIDDELKQLENWAL